MADTLIVFTLPGCPACHRCKQYLNEKGVIFEERSVDNPEYRRQLVEDYKRMATPTLVLGDEIIVGFDQAKIDALLTQLAGPSETP
jgi:glutaredoxin